MCVCFCVGLVSVNFNTFFLAIMWPRLAIFLQYLKKLFFTCFRSVHTLSRENTNLLVSLFLWIHLYFLCFHQKSESSDFLMCFFVCTYLFFFLERATPFSFFTVCFPLFLDYSSYMVMASVSCQWFVSVLFFAATAVLVTCRWNSSFSFSVTMGTSF